jgi:hypothetical protein
MVPDDAGQHIVAQVQKPSDMAKADCQRAMDLATPRFFRAARSRIDSAQRVARTVTLGSIVHPQYENEFGNGIAVSSDRVPFTLGCAGIWSEKARAEHYNDLCQIDGRIVLAGEHVFCVPFPHSLLSRLSSHWLTVNWLRARGYLRAGLPFKEDGEAEGAENGRAVR